MLCSMRDPEPSLHFLCVQCPGHGQGHKASSIHRLGHGAKSNSLEHGNEEVEEEYVGEEQVQAQ